MKLLVLLLLLGLALGQTFQQGNTCINKCKQDHLAVHLGSVLDRLIQGGAASSTQQQVGQQLQTPIIQYIACVRQCVEQEPTRQQQQQQALLDEQQQDFAGTPDDTDMNMNQQQQYVQQQRQLAQRQLPQQQWQLPQQQSGQQQQRGCMPQYQQQQQRMQQQRQLPTEEQRQLYYDEDADEYFYLEDEEDAETYQPTYEDFYPQGGQTQEDQQTQGRDQPGATSQGQNQTRGAGRFSVYNDAGYAARILVKYTDKSGQPQTQQSPRFTGGQTKTIDVPAGAKNVTVTVQAFTGTTAGAESILTKKYNGPVQKCFTIKGTTTRRTYKEQNCRSFKR